MNKKAVVRELRGVVRKLAAMEEPVEALGVRSKSVAARRHTGEAVDKVRHAKAVLADAIEMLD